MDHLHFTFKEICEKTGYASSAIRYYEKEFNLNIPRDANGRRVFTKIEFDKLLFIKELQSKSYTNSEIKRLFLGQGSLQEEIAVTTAVPHSGDNDNNHNSRTVRATDQKLAVKATGSASTNEAVAVMHFIDKKFGELHLSIDQLSENINSKERDVLITENAKLKMELKRKSYEIIELKENLRYSKNQKKGFFQKIFS